MMILKVKDYLQNPSNTHIEDLDYLLNKIKNHITINVYLLEKEYVIDFDGYTLGSMDYFNEQIDELCKTGVDIKLNNVRQMTLKEDYHNVNHIVMMSERDEAPASEVYEQLDLLVDSIIKQSGKCILDFRRASTTVGSDARVYYSQSSVFQITNVRTLTIIAQLKCKYNDKLDYVGIDFKNEGNLAYLLNYFTVPGCDTIEELSKFMKTQYKANDFVAIADMRYNVKSNIDYDEFNPKKQDGVVTQYDALLSSQIDISKLRLGVIIDVQDTYLEYYLVTPCNIEDVSQFQIGDSKKSRYTYTVGSNSAKLYYSDIYSAKESIHGVEMTSEYQLLFDLVESLGVNPPRMRNLYFSKQRSKLYSSVINGKVTKAKKVRQLEESPSLDTLRKRNSLTQTIYGIDDIL